MKCGKTIVLKGIRVAWVVRLGIVLLLSATLIVHAQWYLDPLNPDPVVQQPMPDPVLCSDGENGAFFVSHDFPGIFRPCFIGRVNAEGYLSYADSPPPYQYLLPIDTLGFYRHGSISVTSSEPSGSAIVTAARIYMDEESVIRYGGFSFTKFDTTGRSGFGQVVVTDTGYTLRGKLFVDRNSNGGWDVHSDLVGGLHVVVEAREGGTAMAHFYNHLNSSGEWTHVWPGIAVSADSRSEVSRVIVDGYGGLFVFIKWHHDSPQFADQTTCRRFNQAGEVTNADNVLLPRPYLDLASAVQSEPGQVIVLLDSTLEDADVSHHLYKIDTNGVSLWSSEGRSLVQQSGTQSTYLRSDGFGGFFHSVHDEDANEWRSLRYSGEIELVAVSPLHPRLIPQWADGTGGAYSVYWSSAPGIDPQYVSVYRWDNGFQFAWPDSTLAFSHAADNELGVVNHLVCGDHSLIGAAPWQDGLRLFKVGSDGILGQGTFVHFPSGFVTDFQLESVYPNPFNSTLSIALDVPFNQDVSVSLYDLLGREVDVIYRGRMSANTISYAAPAGMGSGVYFVRAAAGENSVVRKVVLLK